MINLTQHQSTPEQGCIEPDPATKAEIRALLTFDSIPSRSDIITRAEKLAEIASPYEAAMIGGAPYLMAALERELIKVDVIPCYAFSLRESVDRIVDGKVVKTSAFRHVGFVQA